MIACASLSITHASAQVEGDEQEPETGEPRYSNFSTQIIPDVQPGYTTEEAPEFTLDLGSVGREPVTLLGITVNASPLRTTEWKENNGTVVFRPNTPLTPGLNRITVEYEHVIDRKHRENPVSQTFYVNHQRKEPSFAIAEDGVFVVDGKRTFPFGSFRSGLSDNLEKSLEDAVESGFNLVHDYHFARPIRNQKQLEQRIEEGRAYLKRAGELGLGVFLDMPRNLATEENEAMLAEYIAALSQYPALWMWYIWDEPRNVPGDSISPTAAGKVHALLRRLDPGRPTMMLCNRVEQAYAYAPFCEILWVDRYPFVGTAPELSSIAPVVALLRKGQEIVRGEKPVWPVIQLHDNRALPGLVVEGRPPISTDNFRPSPQEVMAQIHACVAADANAIVTYHLPARNFSMKSIPSHWEELTKIFHQSNELAPVWLSQEPRPEFTVVDSANKVMVWTRSYEGKAYFGVVNLSVNTPAKTSLDTGLSGEPDLIQGDGKISQPTSKKIAVDLPPAGVAVFTLDQ